MDSNTEKPAEFRATFGPLEWPVRVKEISKDQAKAELAQFIDAEHLGSVRSKAFCDYIDLEEIKIWQARLERSLYTQNPGYNEEIGLREQIEEARQTRSSIQETVRQRTNELPGYQGARDEVGLLFNTIAAHQKDEYKETVPRADESELRLVARERVIDTATSIKDKYLQSHQEINSSPPSEPPTPSI